MCDEKIHSPRSHIFRQRETHLAFQRLESIPCRHFPTHRRLCGNYMVACRACHANSRTASRSGPGAFCAPVPFDVSAASAPLEICLRAMQVPRLNLKACPCSDKGSLLRDGSNNCIKNLFSALASYAAAGCKGTVNYIAGFRCGWIGAVSGEVPSR